MRSWVQALEYLDGPERDRAGKPIPFPREHVFPYAFRHSHAQRHADAGTPVDTLKELLGHYAGDLVKLITLGGCLVEAGQQSVEDFLPPGLALGGGVVALLLDGGTELDGGLEEGAGLADRLEVAVQADGRAQ